MSQRLGNALLLLWILFGLLLPQSLKAESRRDLTERLNAGITAYEHGGYAEAAAKLAALLYPLKLSNRQDIVRAKSHLGLCYFALGRTDEAAAEFRDVFKIDPSWKPDPVYIPPDVILFIERQRPPPRPDNREVQVPGLGEVLEVGTLKPPGRTPLLLLPLGIPQWQHGDRARAATLASAQLSLLAANVGTYWYLRVNNTPAQAEQLYTQLTVARVTNLSSFVLLVGTVAFGAGDALYRYRQPPEPESRSLRPRLQVSPSGLAMELRF